MKISIVVPAYNEEKLLGATLAHLKRAARAFEQRGWQVEIVVCDNNSSDQTGQVASASGARVVFEPVNQIGRARNTGAAAASGDWLVFVDADSKPSPALFSAVADCITTGRFIAGGATVRFDEADRLSRLFAEGWNRLSRTMKWLAGSFIFVDAQAFRKVGGFAAELYAAEEIDLSRRLKSLGRSTGKRVVVLHKHPLETSARKLHLYKRREHARFLLRAVVTAGRSMKNREECFPWYDGRR